MDSSIVFITCISQVYYRKCQKYFISKDLFYLIETVVLRPIFKYFEVSYTLAMNLSPSRAIFMIVLLFPVLLPFSTNPARKAATAQLIPYIFPIIETDDIVVIGRIISTLAPIPKMDQLADNMTAQNSDNQAERFSMTRNVTWLLSGDWALIADKNGNNITFVAEFVKVTTDGAMPHTHTITNFRSSTNLQAANLSEGNATITGTSDVYFNDELAWKQVATDLTLMNGTALAINLSGVDGHFHGEPIYGIVNSFAKDGAYIAMPETDISEAIEGRFSGLETNTTQTDQSVANQTSQETRTSTEEARDVIGNIAQSIKDFFDHN